MRRPWRFPWDELIITFVGVAVALLPLLLWILATRLVSTAREVAVAVGTGVLASAGFDPSRPRSFPAAILAALADQVTMDGLREAARFVVSIPGAISEGFARAFGAAIAEDIGRFVAVVVFLVTYLGSSLAILVLVYLCPPWLRLRLLLALLPYAEWDLLVELGKLSFGS